VTARGGQLVPREGGQHPLNVAQLAGRGGVGWERGGRDDQLALQQARLHGDGPPVGRLAQRGDHLLEEERLAVGARDRVGARADGSEVGRDAAEAQRGEPDRHQHADGGHDDHRADEGALPAAAVVGRVISRRWS